MDGVLLIDKHKDCTSRDIVNDIIKKFNTKKVGHTGTLDPIATGVMVVCVGRATKLVNYLTSKEKEYEAKVELGTLTDTLDCTGNIIKEEIISLTDKEIEEAILKMKGKYEQEVPIYSAIRVNGKKLYEYARSNEEVVLPKREVEVKDICLSSEIERLNNKIYFSFKCTVSKGTYIRSLINDIAKNLNTVGIMCELRRIKQGSFDIKDCKIINEITTTDILKVSDVIDDICKVKVDENLKNDILNGKIITNEYNVDKILFMSEDNKALAIYKKYDKDELLLKPDVMLGGI